MCGTFPVDVPADEIRTEQVTTTGSGFDIKVPSPISIAGTLQVADQDAILIPLVFLGRSVEYIANTGTITASGGKSGINNTNIIEKVVNAQGAGNPSGPLTYTGILPQRYEIIINSPTDYGILKVDSASAASTNTTFDIYSGDIDGIPSSVLTETTYSSVLQGFNNLSDLTGTSGTFGEDFSYELVQQNTTTNWDLVVTLMSAPEITTGSSVALSDIGVTVEPIFDGGTLLLADSDQSNLAFLVRSAGGTITAPETGSAELSGVLSGGGALTFNGDATTVITGANTYSGGTTVAAGTLSVAGLSPTGTGPVTVEPNAVLSGRGTIKGQLIVFGTLKPGNSPGYLETTADVDLEAGSTYLQDIAGTMQANESSPIGASGYYAYLNIQGGELRIESGATLTPRLANLFTTGQPGHGSTPYTPALGDRFRIITAEKGIEGRFTEVTQPEELAADTSLAVFYDIQGSNSIDLSVIPSSYTLTIASGSGNQNAASVGAALDQIAQANRSATSTQTQDELLSAIASQRSATAIANYAQGLSGEVYAANVAVSAQTTQRLHQTIRGQLGLANPVLGQSFEQTGNQSSGLGLSLNNGSEPSSPQEVSEIHHVWGNATYQRGVRSSDSHSGGWNSNLYQLAFGTDMYTSSNLQLGGGFSLSNTTLSPTYGSSTIQQGSVFAYGKMSAQTFVIDAVASLGLGSSNISRQDMSGLTNGFNDTSVYGKDAMLSLGISRPIELRNMYLTPYAQVTWQGAMQESVNEGDSPAALTVNRFTGNSVRGVVGLATTSKGKNPATEKYTYGAYIGVGADSNNLLNPTLTASLAGIGTDITTPEAGKVFAQVGWYGTIRLSKTSFAYLGISGEARERQTLGTINAGLRVRF